MNIVIIGCGNIGSRLLQSVSNITEDALGKLHIYAIEPNEAAWQTVRDRFEEANHGAHDLYLYASDQGLPPTADLLIVAVDANNRLSALRSALTRCKPDNIILEKVLFTAFQDYEAAQHLIRKTGATCFVNCTRNVWPGYVDLKRNLSSLGDLKRFSVSGSQWNLASNSIHFLAAIEYLTGDQVARIDIDHETARVHDAKRVGYREITGRLSGRTNRGSEFSLASIEEPGHTLQVKIEFESRTATIVESAQTLTWDCGKTETFGMLHASQLSECLVQILMNKSSDLPQLYESSKLHIPLLKTLNKIFYGQDTQELICPVT